MNNISFKKVNFKIIEKIKVAYKFYLINNKDINKINVFKKNGITITIYKTNSILFQGNNSENEAYIFFPILKNYLLNNKKNISITYFKKDVIGNDEVGVGDIFGPLVITASYIPNKTFNNLIILPIKDSKKMSNKQILYLAPIIKKLIKSVTLIINNELYNKLYIIYKNSNIIKALFHNKALIMLLKKYKLINKTIFIDQFVNKKKYFEYLKKTKSVIKNNIIFITKGEKKSLAIACSSILSRATFLIKIKELEKKYNIFFPLGANENVKILARKYKIIFPIFIYKKFLKEHFNLN